MEPENFFQSENEATLQWIRPYQVHGARFAEIGFSFASDPEGTVRRARISENLIYDSAKAGDRVKIALLLGNVSRVSKVE